MSEQRNRSGWSSYEEAANQGPWSLTRKVLVFGIPFILLVSLVGFVLANVFEGAGVLHDEFGPNASRDKYEWFVQQASFIEKANNDIKTQEQAVRTVDQTYISIYGADPAKWPPSAQAQYQHERKNAYDYYAGVVTNRNKLVSDYNAKSRDFFWEKYKSEPDLPPQTYEAYVIPAEISAPFAPSATSTPS